LRNDESFGSFWKLARLEQARLGIEDPTLPRKRRRPQIIDNYFTTTANNTTYNPETTEEMHRKIYYEAVDNAVQTITARFDQPDWAVYRNMQQSLIDALNGQRYEEELNAALQKHDTKSETVSPTSCCFGKATACDACN